MTFGGRAKLPGQKGKPWVATERLRRILENVRIAARKAVGEPRALWERRQ